MAISPLNWMEINATAFNHNIEQYKHIVGTGNLAAVIKSNAYGHDMHLIAKLCEQNPHVDWLCVANLSDAIALRAENITKPILILSYLDEDVHLAGLHDIDFVCYETDLLERANQAGAAIDKKLNIHVKIDTGVSRFGLMPDEAIAFIQKAVNLPYINVRGIFTHFAQAQQADQSYTYEQLSIFNAILSQLDELGIDITYKHCANSAATTILEPGRCNFFRVGAGLYGIWPSEFVHITTRQKYPDFSLEHVLTWKTTVIGMRTIPAGSTIGYDRTFTTTRDTTIALLPVGYFEGYDRRLSNTGMVAIHDSLAPIVGRVCMNVIMVDVTEIKQIKKGDIALLIGSYQGIRPMDIAQQTGSMNAREILARLNMQIPRVLVEKNIATDYRNSRFFDKLIMRP